jgi:PmbA protein
MDMSSEGSLRGSEPFDYEGNPTLNLPLIEDGYLRNFLHNNRTGARFNVQSTGNAVGVGGWVFPGPRHVSIRPGSMGRDTEALFSELGNGVFILNNWYTRYQNIKEGLFSTVGRDAVLLVKSGKPVARLRGVRITDTFQKLLRNYVDSSREAQQVYWWDMPIPGSSPYVMLRGLRLSKGPEG